jgi:restriction system protein
MSKTGLTRPGTQWRPAQHRVAEIHMRIGALQESILAQRREFLEVSDEQQAYFQRRLAEAQFRTDAIMRTISQHQSLLQTRKRSDDKRIQEIEESLKSDGSEAFASNVRKFLTIPAVPDDLRPPCRAAYAQDRRTLLIECELPSREVIPSATAYRYVRSNDALIDEPRPDDDVRRLYSDLISRIALRVLAEAFCITRSDRVETIILDACISATDRATGGHVRPALISVHASRESFAEVNLDEPELDPAACLGRHLGALVSPHPYELEPVQPLLDFDLSVPRVPAWLDEATGPQHRPDLLDLDPVQFESLVRTLFERLGVKSWVTQSVDDGVDAVAAMNDSIIGGLCVLQAKRYSRVVPLDAVRSLAGIMQDKRAAKGVLITTSWVGKAGHDFAERNGAIEVIDGRQLRFLLKEHLGLDARIGLKKLPPGWEREDILPEKADA